MLVLDLCIEIRVNYKVAFLTHKSGSFSKFCFALFSPLFDGCQYNTGSSGWFI